MPYLQQLFLIRTSIASPFDTYRHGPNVLKQRSFILFIGSVLWCRCTIAADKIGGDVYGANTSRRHRARARTCAWPWFYEPSDGIFAPCASERVTIVRSRRSAMDYALDWRSRCCGCVSMHSLTSSTPPSSE